MRRSRPCRRRTRARRRSACGRGGRASTLAEVEAARFEERSVARTWVMRGTLHLIPAEDARWMVALLGPDRAPQERAADRGARGRRPTRGRRAGGARRRPAHPARAHRRGAQVRHAAGPPAGAGVAHRRARAAGRDHRGAGGPVRALRRLARPPRPHRPTRSSSSPAATPTRTRPSGAGGLRGLVGAAGARGARAPTGSWSSRRSRCSGRRASVPPGLEPAPPHVRLLPRFDGWLLGHRDRSLIMRRRARQGGPPRRRHPGRHARRRRPHRGNVEARPRRPARRDRLRRPAGSRRRGGGRRQVPGQGALTGVDVRSWSA